MVVVYLLTLELFMFHCGEFSFYRNSQQKHRGDSKHLHPAPRRTEISRGGR